MGYQFSGRIKVRWIAPLGIATWVLPVVTAVIVFYLESRLNWRDDESISDVKLQITSLNGVN